MKKLLKTIVLTLILFTFALPLTACEEVRNDDRPYSPNLSTPFDEYRPDEGIEIDGIFSEEEWNEVNWKTWSYTDTDRRLPAETNNNLTVTVEMSTIFGERGIYFGIICDDPYLWNNSRRAETYNSAIEFRVARVDDVKCDGDKPAYEINISTNQKVYFSIFSADGSLQRGANFQRNEDMPFSKIEVDVTSLNTSVAGNGYSCELFMPYTDFGMEKLDEIMLYPALIRHYNNEQTGGRLYYSFVKEIGGGSHNPASWWKFNETGIKKAEVTVSADGNGSVVAEQPSLLLPGEKLPVKVTPNDGYVLDKIIVDGVNQIDNLTFSANGSVNQAIITVAEKTDIKGYFKVAPNKVAITGTITDDGQALSQEKASGLKAYFFTGATVTELNVGASGEISGNAYPLDGELYIVKNGEIVARKTLDLSSTTVATIDLTNFVRYTRLTTAGSSSVEVRLNAYADSLTGDIAKKKNSVTVLYYGYDNPNLLTEQGEINSSALEVLNNFNFGSSIHVTDGSRSGYFNFQILNYNNGGLWALKVNDNSNIGITDTANGVFDASGLKALIEGRFTVIIEKADTLIKVSYGYDGNYKKAITIDLTNRTNLIKKSYTGANECKISSITLQTYDTKKYATCSLRGIHYEGISSIEEI